MQNKGRRTKRAFTITELVIVIAVIAILAAVLIPTFVTVVNKARESNDIAMARNMNTVLTAESAQSQPKEFSEVIGILEEGGFVLSNLNPTAEGNYFAWDSETNQILYLDVSFGVIYCSKTLSSETINPNWHFAVSTSEEQAKVTAAGGSVTLVPKSEDLLEEVSELTGTQTVYIQDSISVSDPVTKAFCIDGADKTITLNLSDVVTINEGAAEFGGKRAFEVKNGATLNIVGGVIDAKSSGTDGSYGSVRVEKNGTANIVGTTLYNYRKNGMNVKTLDGVANLKNTTIISVTGGCVEAGGVYEGGVMKPGVTTVDDCVFTQTGYADFTSSVFAACYGGTLNVNSGTYTGENHIAYVFSSGGILNLKGGTYTKTQQNEHAFFVLQTDGSYNYNAAKLNISGGTYVAENGSEISFSLTRNSRVEITGGTFNGKAYCDYMEAEWRSMVAESCRDKCTVSVEGAGASARVVIEYPDV